MREGPDSLRTMKSFAKKQPRTFRHMAPEYHPPEAPLLREDTVAPQPLIRSDRQRSSSIAVYNKPKKFVSIVERLKSKHSELI